jgi:hypothetical protein
MNCKIGLLDTSRHDYLLNLFNTQSILAIYEHINNHGPGGKQVVVEAELILLVVVQQDHRPGVILFLQRDSIKRFFVLFLNLSMNRGIVYAS